MSSMSNAQLVVSAVAASKNIVAFTHPPPTLPYPAVRYYCNLELAFVNFSCESFRSIFVSNKNIFDSSICLLACSFIGNPCVISRLSSRTCCFQED